MSYSRPIKDFVSLFKAGTISQALIFLSIPVVLHKYDPESFGKFTIYISIATLIGVISALKIERALVVEDDSVFSYFFKLCIFLTVTNSLACYWVVDISIDLLGYAEPNRQLIAMCSALYCFVTGLNQLTAHIAIRQKLSPIIGFSDLIFAGVLVGLLTTITPAKDSTLTLLVIYTLAKGFALLGYVKIDVKEIKGWFVTNGKPTASTLIKYTHPVWTTILSNLQFRGIYYLSGVSYGVVATGNISLAHRITYSPVNLIGTALRRAYFREFKHHGENSKSINKHVNNILTYGSVLSLLLFPVTYLILDASTPYIPENWSGLSIYILILYPAASILILLSWLDRVYDAKGLQHRALFYEAVYTAVLYAVLFAILSLSSVDTFLKVYTTITVIYNLVWAALTLKLLEIRDISIYVLGVCHVLTTLLVLVIV